MKNFKNSTYRSECTTQFSKINVSWTQSRIALATAIT